MQLRLIKEIHQQNPWILDKNISFLKIPFFYNRLQSEMLMNPEWDSFCTILIGPRRAGKTTLGKFLSQNLIKTGRFKEFLYLNCDLEEIRNWLISPLFIDEAFEQFSLTSPIIFIDEVQRLKSPGLLLKTIIDLNRDLKLIASGSSQLEMQSKVEEHLTGRHFSSLILPLSFLEWSASKHLEELLIYGAYPQIIDTKAKELLLGQLYQDYVNKDIIEILRLNQPDIFLKLLSLIAHSSGQLVNYSQLSLDCQVSMAIIKNYLDIAKKTFIIKEVTPFVGNKRTEITTNPVFYFIDNGFRNYAMRNFSDINSRVDAGLLVESLVFQELTKFIYQNFLNYSIHYWRTKSGAEVDFIIKKNETQFLPIEVKYRNLKKPSLTRSYHSFIEAYKPKNAVVITKDLISKQVIKETTIHYVPLELLADIFKLILGL